MKCFLTAFSAFGMALFACADGTFTNGEAVCFFGDSITHGGGVMSVPPSYPLYNWETYSSVPIKNLGVSGNTTQDIPAITPLISGTTPPSY